MKPWVEAKMKKEIWDTVLLWSCYDYYRPTKDIAILLGVSRRTVDSRIRRFAEKNPTAYQKIMADRAAIKASTIRQINSFESPLSLDDVPESAIKEIF